VRSRLLKNEVDWCGNVAQQQNKAELSSLGRNDVSLGEMLDQVTTILASTKSLKNCSCGL
jgi:hypothetical protein